MQAEFGSTMHRILFVRQLILLNVDACKLVRNVHNNFLVQIHALI